MFETSPHQSRLARDETDAPRSLVARLARTRITTWLDQAAVPFWLTHGIDHNGGGFHEILDFSGAPVVAEKRLRTMARQTYCFATAAQRGWGNVVDCHGAVAHGMSFLNTQARQADGRLAKTFTFDGTVLDRTQDAYDYAFVLFASAAAVQVGSEAAASLGRDIMRQLEGDFYLGRGRGYREFADGGDGSDVHGVRRANPHMHLLEAFTAWHRATGDPMAAARAAEIVELFYAHFFDEVTWSLREFMDVNLSPLRDARGDIREPGHAFEWAWLLHDFDAMQSARTRWTVQRLIASATSFATNPVTGLTYQEVSQHGDVLDDTSRSWPQTEAIRAMLALQQGGMSRSMADIDARVDQLFRHHISPAPAGLWHDRIAANGATLSESVPASILYHLLSAFTAVLDHTSDAP